MKYLVIILGISCLFLLIACLTRKSKDEVDNEKWIEFHGVTDGETNYELITKPIEEKRDKVNLAAVMIYYAVPLKYTLEGKLLMPESQLKDMEWLWNITLKSKDTTWYREHLMPR